MSKSVRETYLPCEPIPGERGGEFGPEHLDRHILAREAVRGSVDDR
jgi:hypothetical protein